jgi:hypothetical protein
LLLLQLQYLQCIFSLVLCIVDCLFDDLMPLFTPFNYIVIISYLE